jgi:hypothetical protein
VDVQNFAAIPISARCIKSERAAHLQCTIR